MREEKRSDWADADPTDFSARNFFQGVTAATQNDPVKASQKLNAPTFVLCCSKDEKNGASLSRQKESKCGDIREEKQNLVSALNHTSSINALNIEIAEILKKRGFLRKHNAEGKFHLILGGCNGKGIPFKRVSQLFRYDYGIKPLLNFHQSLLQLKKHSWLYARFKDSAIGAHIRASFTLLPNDSNIEYNKDLVQEISRLSENGASFLRAELGAVRELSESELKALKRDVLKPLECSLRIDEDLKGFEPYSVRVLVTPTGEICFQETPKTKPEKELILNMLNSILGGHEEPEQDFAAYQLMDFVFVRHRVRKFILLKVELNPLLTAESVRECSKAIFQLCIKPYFAKWFPCSDASDSLAFKKL